MARITRTPMSMASFKNPSSHSCKCAACFVGITKKWFDDNGLISKKASELEVRWRKWQGIAPETILQKMHSVDAIVIYQMGDCLR